MKYVRLLFLVCLFVSCEKQVEYKPRLFKPTDLSVTTAYNGFNVSWKQSPGANGYCVDIAYDAAFTQIDTSVCVSGATLKTTIGNLAETQFYHVRLKAIHTDRTRDSKFLYATGTTAAEYSIFYPINNDSLSFSTALLTWRNKVKAHHLLIQPDQGDAYTYKLTKQILSDCRMRLPDLQAGMRYRVTMMDSINTSFGRTSFIMPSLPSNLIRINTTDPGALTAAIASSSAGATILLDAAGPYDYSTTEFIIPHALTIMGEPGLPQKQVYVKAFLLGTSNSGESLNIGDVAIRHLKCSGMALTSGVEQVDKEPNHKLISCYCKKTPSVQINSITIEDCEVCHYCSGLIELVENLTSSSHRVRVNDIVVNNCVIYDMGRNRNNYPSLISMSNKSDKNGYCRHYTLSNSTFHHFYRGLIEARVFTSIDGYTDPDVTMTNCTVDQMGDRYINSSFWWGTNTEAVKNVFDFKATNVTTDIMVTITNCVWGELSTTYLSNKFVQGVSTTTVNTFMLSSSKQLIPTGTALMDPITATPQELFPHRDKGTYEIGSTGSVAQAGDPRWIKKNE